MSDPIRDDFEAAANQNDYHTLRTRGGDYINNEVAVAWHFYQLAYAAGQKAEREAICIQWEGADATIAEVERLRADRDSWRRVCEKETEAKH